MTYQPLDYVEFSVSDLGAAKRFYGGAFGWEFTDYGPDYAGIRTADGRGEVGGLNPHGAGGPGGVMPLVRSADLDASLAAAESAGGTVLEPPHDYPGGRRFVVADPDGNRVGVYQPSE
jgi:predicted enzyme related to lactoylglutathione lyase